MSLRRIAKRWLYGSCPGLAGSFPYFGTRVFFPPRSLLFERACREGIFEADLLGVLLSLVRAQTTYIDLGANIGLMSVPVLATLSDIQVLSVEPSPANLPWLKRTLQKSSFLSRWQVLGKAVSDSAGPVEFFSCRHNGGALDGLKDTGRGGDPEKLLVEGTTVDQAWAELGQPKVSCIKIDVEGAELKVLHGARECLARERPGILLEWNAVNIAAYDLSPDAILSFARDAGYDLLGIAPFWPISSIAQLRLAMQERENFLLLPK